MRRIIFFDMNKGTEHYDVQLRPVPNSPKYQILINGRLRYDGTTFRLPVCLERLDAYTRNGFTVLIRSRRTAGLLKRFARAASTNPLDRPSYAPPKGH